MADQEYSKWKINESSFLRWLRQNLIYDVAMFMVSYQIYDWHDPFVR